MYRQHCCTGRQLPVKHRCCLLSPVRQHNGLYIRGLNSKGVQSALLGIKLVVTRSESGTSKHMDIRDTRTEQWYNWFWCLCFLTILFVYYNNGMEITVLHLAFIYPALRRSQLLLSIQNGPSEYPCPLAALYIQPAVTFILSIAPQKALSGRQGVYRYLHFTEGVAEPSVICPKLCSQVVLQPDLEFKPYKLIFTIWLIFLPQHIKSCHILITWTAIKLETLTISKAALTINTEGIWKANYVS